MPEGAFEQNRAVPRRTVIGPRGVAEMFVQIVIFAGQRRSAAVPRPGVDEQAVAKGQEMRVASIAQLHGEPMHQIPLPGVIAR